MRSPLVAVAVLVSLTTLGLPHAIGPGHDADCDIIIVAHDASAHQIHADRTGDTTDTVHCLACHWARSFKPRSDTTYLRRPPWPPASDSSSTR